MNLKHISREEIEQLQKLSPFELKSKLIELAGEHEQRTTFQMLNAGRGNPNFIAPTPREAFFALGGFALEESRANRQWDPELVGVPQKNGIAQRFRDWLGRHEGEPGVELLSRVLEYGIEQCAFNPDSFVWELADSIIGDHYPSPDRMLVHNEEITKRYLMQELAPGKDLGQYDLFAVEGGTAAMCYIFDSLMLNRLVHRGDKVALMTPIFTPYLEITELDEFAFEQVHIQASGTYEDGRHNWQFPDSEIDKLLDPDIKILYCVNPTNPPSVRIAAESLQRIADIVNTKRQDLIVITDDVYSTFIDGFESLMGAAPRNTITVYSFSKYFGATGWRLGTIGIARDNIFDELLAALPEEDKQALDKRYSPLTLEPRSIRFIDRLVADSRNVALNHTAGLSLPQQCQMLLFSAYCLLDRENHYKQQAQALIARRFKALQDGMQIELEKDPNRVGYYAELDFLIWAAERATPGFIEFVKANYEPTDILFRLAEQTGVVLLNGGGFEGPEWSVRVSLANLRDVQYEEIGKAMIAAANQYAAEFEASKT
ncbi:aspartate 4-decarboxylase [Mycolicibacterium sp. 050232]|uniref:aspartate 4-decarboxylase n=1 Tax=Mycolicibacterium sp. 050232 TaxID=3113982 RepID=UPI002E2B977A|nr:aspartate 4-decarboxylase [Mycolicibacterium sp. 050232]MED5815112.1 aspartate 4-decarboxylase [Mycolicibacterium sp. 050232]